MPGTRLRGSRLDELVAASAFVRDEELAAVDDANAELLFLAITGSPNTDDEDGDGDTAVVRLHRRRISPVLVAAAAVVLIAALVSSLVLYRPTNSGVGASVNVALSTKSGAIFEASVPKSDIINGEVQLSKLGPVVAVIYRDHFVGVVDRADLVPTISATTLPTVACGTGGVNVYGEDGGAVVGHLYAGAGYVPVGSTPDCDLNPLGQPQTTVLPTPPCSALITASGTVTIHQCATNATGAGGVTGGIAPAGDSGASAPGGNSGQ